MPWLPQEAIIASPCIMQVFVAARGGTSIELADVRATHLLLLPPKFALTRHKLSRIPCTAEACTSTLESLSLHARSAFVIRHPWARNKSSSASPGRHMLHASRSVRQQPRMAQTACAQSPLCGILCNAHVAMLWTYIHPHSNVMSTLMT